jgi:hypothetical protein
MKLTSSPYAPSNFVYEPRVNGGWFTGTAFEEKAAWGTIECYPETGYLVNQTLQSAHPPLLAMYHYPGANHRPGNNTPFLPGIQQCTNYGLSLIDVGPEKKMCKK